MQGDDARPDNPGATPGTRSGPRHAAPRKSLLTRVHVPAGKAIALAAMPTAVLMGMGLTPRLAQADELPKNPFKGNSCVTQSDTPAPQDSSSATPSATPSPTSGSTAAASPTAAAQQTPQATQKAAGTPSSGSTATPSATPSASPTKSTNPLDPLGVGSAINGLVGGVVKTITGTSTTSSSPTPTASPTPTPSATPSASGSGSGSGSGSAAGAVSGVTKTVQQVAGAVTSGTSGVLAKAASVASPTPSASSTSQAYPCPTLNSAALANASLEATPELLPDTPWTLKTDLLTLTGLDYHGVVKVKTWNGTVKDVLKFTATGVDIRNLHQITDGPDGTKFHVQAAPGSTSTIRNGTVTMYTEELKGNLFGLIPVTFTPTSPPPLNVPAAFFTNVTVTQAGQFGGTLTVPGMHLYPGS